MSLIEDSKQLRIPFEDIKEATQNFTTLIGRGGYGPVYRGQLSLSAKLTTLAVKRLQTDYGQGVKEFLTEIQLLSRYKHQNLVSLVGFCEELNEKFLVYQYAERGSLDNYLTQNKTKGSLTWKRRINICIDAARGLDHLHNHVAQNQRVIHRDIKSANILLDHNWKAMIADFGLSKIGRANENDSYLITNPSGTHGYCDPAYIRTGILTKESDVYSFGVVLFEVLCGRLCFINVNSEERFLAPLAQRYYQEGKLNLIIDRDLKNYIISDSMKVFSEIAFQCLNDDRKLRPSIGLVLKKLEKSLNLLDKEEAPELLELEEALELKKLVETLQIQQFEETCEVQELEEALGLHKLVETLQLQFKEENDLEKSELKNLSSSNVEWNNLLPIDYKQYIYYSNKDMMNTPQTDVTFPTKEEAYSILSRGVLIKVNNEVNMWFWITKLDGKKCFMLPPTLVSYNERLVKIRRIPSKESRIENVVHLSPSKVVGMRFEVSTSLLSPNTTYGCYLVYKMQQHFGWERMVTMKLDDGRTLLGEQLDKLITYLTIPQSPVIGPQGVCSSPRPINELKTVQLPRKRKDGWLELNLGTKSDIHWMNIRPNQQYDHFWRRENSWKSCLFPCLSDNDSSNVYRDAKSKSNNFTIDPQHISNINIYMWPLCNPTETPELIVQGVEFVPV